MDGLREFILTLVSRYRETKRQSTYLDYFHYAQVEGKKYAPEKWSDVNRAIYRDHW